MATLSSPEDTPDETDRATVEPSRCSIVSKPKAEGRAARSWTSRDHHCAYHNPPIRRAHSVRKLVDELSTGSNSKSIVG